MTDADIAARLYGTPAPAPARVSAEEDIAARMYSAQAPAAPASPAAPAQRTEPAQADKAAETLFGADAPQEYTFRTPVGFEHLVPDPAKHAEFVTYARENKLSQAAAQRLVDMHVQSAFSPKK